MDENELKRLENDFKATSCIEDKDERIEHLEWLCRVLISELKIRV